MNPALKWVCGTLVAALCVPTAGAISDSVPADKTALCTKQPKGPGGVPLSLAQWAEGARIFSGLGDFHRPISTHSREAQAISTRACGFSGHYEATRSFAKVYRRALRRADVVLTASAF